MPVPGTDGKLSASGYVDGLGVVDTGSGPRQRPEGLGVLRLDGGPRWLRGHAELRGRIGGPFEGGPGAGVYEFSNTFQNRSPSLEINELWMELRGARAELRAGIQRVAWGRLDGIPPTDVVNPRDYHDPFVQDAEERKIGVPALLGTWFPPDPGIGDLTGLRAQLMYIPIAVPPRLALAEERWFPSSTEVRGLELPSMLRDITVPEAWRRPRVDFGTSNAAPPRTFDQGALAARIGGSLGAADWDLYHYSGNETGPNLILESYARVNPDKKRALSAVARVAQQHGFIHMTGAAVAVPLGGFTVRLEGAHFLDRPYLARTSDVVRRFIPPSERQFNRLGSGKTIVTRFPPLFPTLDSVEWGIGADYLWRGFQPILQLNQIVFLEDTPTLLVGDPDTRLVGILRKRVLDDRLELEFRSTYQIERDGWFVLPRISYDLRDDIRLRIGYLVIGGSKNSLIGQFKGNDEVIFQARYSF